MRQIVFLILEEKGPDLWKLLLETCSQYTPLVEPLGDSSLYLDLSGCGSAPGIIRAVSRSLLAAQGTYARLRAGLAASRLLARLAVQPFLHYSPPASYQVISSPGLLLVKILPGCEKDFINPLPLTSLPSLSRQALKSLSRLGFKNTGELAGLSSEQLAQLNIESPGKLLQHINGIDSSPVTGLYPPSRITYPLNLEAGFNRVRIEALLRSAAFRLEGLLEERHAGCHYISLQGRRGEKTLLNERLLSSHCYKAEQLLNIFLSLFPWEYAGSDHLDLQIILQDLVTLSFQQPDLFFYRVFFNKQEQEKQVEELIQNLKKRFPENLKQGLDINRREKVLAFWDPWRKGPGPSPRA